MLIGYIIGFVNALVLCVLAIALDRHGFVETVERTVDKIHAPKGDIFLPEEEPLADKLDDHADE